MISMYLHGTLFKYYLLYGDFWNSSVYQHRVLARMGRSLVITHSKRRGERLLESAYWIKEAK